MDIKKKLYFNDENNCKECTKFIKLKMCSGLINFKENHDIKLVKSKFIQSGIYFNYMLHDCPQPETVYFEDKEKCKLLNKIILKYEPNLFIKKIDKYIKITIIVLFFLDKIIPDTKNKEKLLISKIEKCRNENLNKMNNLIICYKLVNLLKDYQRFLHKLNFKLMNEIKFFNNQFMTFKEKLVLGKESIIMSINKFIILEKQFEKIKDQLLFHSKYYNITFCYDNKDIDVNSILNFIDIINSEFNKKFIEYKIAV